MGVGINGASRDKDMTLCIESVMSNPFMPHISLLLKISNLRSCKITNRVWDGGIFNIFEGTYK